MELILTLLSGGAVGAFLRPRTIMTVLVAITAPFPGSRLHNRYVEALSLLCAADAKPKKARRR